MGVLKGGMKIEASGVTLVYTEDTDVTVGATLDSCGWVPERDAERVDAGADVVTVTALSPDQSARYRDAYGSRGKGTATLEALRMGIQEVRVTEDGRRVTRRGKDARLYADALAQQNAISADLLAEVIHRLTRGTALEEGYAFARACLGYEPPAPTAEEDEPHDDATFPGDDA